LESEGITDFTLAGHSLGGYLSARYALKYPEKLNGLVLISPAGVPIPPHKEERVNPNQLPIGLRTIHNLFKMAFTPQDIVRVVGNKNMIKKFIGSRFSEQWAGREVELELVTNYLYHMTIARGNGEYALGTILEPIFYRVPTKPVAISAANDPNRPVDRKTVQQAQFTVRTSFYAREPLQEDLCEFKKPILLMFGDTDWLAFPRAKHAVDIWKAHGSPFSELDIVPNAGHHIYYDNPQQFSSSIIDWRRKIESSTTNEVHGKSIKVEM